MPYEGNRRESEGYNAIMGEIRLQAGSEDVWGWALNNLGGLGDVYYAATGEELPEYGVAPGLRDPMDMQGHLASDDGEYPASMFWELYDARHFTVEDIKRAYMVLNRYADWVKLAGLNY